MDQIFVANPKGGCGKTTVATQLAGYYSLQGCKVLLVDHDAQKSSSDWLASRPKKLPEIDLIVASVGERIDFRGAEIVVHDMPAAWSLEHVADILHTGDKVLIPVLSSPTDIKACLRFIMELHRSGVMECGIQAGLIANRTRANTNFYNVLLTFLERVDLPLVATLRDTQNYVKAMNYGLTLFDLAPSKAKKDIEQWNPILTWLFPDKKDSEQLKTA